jgi:hypothetical protein
MGGHDRGKKVEWGRVYWVSEGEERTTHSSRSVAPSVRCGAWGSTLAGSHKAPAERAMVQRASRSGQGIPSTSLDPPRHRPPEECVRVSEEDLGLGLRGEGEAADKTHAPGVPGAGKRPGLSRGAEYLKKCRLGGSVMREGAWQGSHLRRRCYPHL